MKPYLITLLISLAALTTVDAQNTAKTEEIKILTSTQCEMCKKRVETAMAYEKGVVRSDLNLTTKVLTVVYKPSKTTPEKIRKAVAAVGYDADDVPANAEAYAKLPPCCKKPDDPEHTGH